MAAERPFAGRSRSRFSREPERVLAQPVSVRSNFLGPRVSFTSGRAVRRGPGEAGVSGEAANVGHVEASEPGKFKTI